MNGLTEGRIVHYILPDGPKQGEHRPAIVVKYWGKTDPNDVQGVCNLQVFTDSDKDSKYNDELPQVMWVTSVHIGTNLPGSEGTYGTWHWIEKE
jgi:hypothetical protein